MGVNQRYDIKVNPPKPTPAEMDQHKNFNRILSQYNRSKSRKALHEPVNRVNKLLPVVIVSILILLLVFYYNKFKARPEEGPKPADTENVSAQYPNKLMNEEGIASKAVNHVFKIL